MLIWDERAFYGVEEKPGFGNGMAISNRPQNRKTL